MSSRSETYSRIHNHNCYAHTLTHTRTQRPSDACCRKYFMNEPVNMSDSELANIEHHQTLCRQLRHNHHFLSFLMKMKSVSISFTDPVRFIIISSSAAPISNWVFTLVNKDVMSLAGNCWNTIIFKSMSLTP